MTATEVAIVNDEGNSEDSPEVAPAIPVDRLTRRLDHMVPDPE